MLYHPLRWIVVCVFLALTAFGCTDATESDETGSLSLDLVIGDGVIINQVEWTISGGPEEPPMDPMSGTIDTTAPGSTASVEVFGLPPTVGPDYTITMEATSIDEETTCIGSENFGIDIGEVTEIMVFLNCKRPQRLGAVRVNGKFNICAELTKATAAPLETSVGNDIDLTAQAEDADADPITYDWTATGGSIADPSAASTTYTCEVAGDHIIRISVTDDDDYCDMAEWTFPVTCSPRFLECEIDADCEGPDERCSEGSCIPNVECSDSEDCGPLERCFENTCITNTCDLDNDCGPLELCIDLSCKPVECKVDGDCTGPDERCSENSCLPNIECSGDEDCGPLELCLDNTCVLQP